MQPVAPAPVARFRGLRLALGVVAVLAVLVGGGVLARMWVLQQYYVGTSQEHVAIFQGVRGSVLGLPLQHLVEETDIALTDLPEATRNTVEDGILVTEGGLTGAQAKVALLRGGMLAPCPTRRAGGSVRGSGPAGTRSAARAHRPRAGRAPPTRARPPRRASTPPRSRRWPPNRASTAGR